VAVGLLAGFLSGVFGVGGGILLVPGFVLLLEMEQRLAHGTSLAAILPIAVAGVVGYAAHGSVDLPAAALLALGAAGGAVVGTRLLDRLPFAALRLAFGVLMIAAAIRLFSASEAGAGSRPLTLTAAIALIAIGAGAGLLAGLLGVGGGIVMVPGLVLLLGISDVLAKGTSLLVIIPTALAGTARNVAAGNTDVPVAVAAGLAGAAAAFPGSVLAIHLDPSLSRALFALLLVVAAAQLLLRRPV
jgi:uncharacterized membrane protein YfcA